MKANIVKYEQSNCNEENQKEEQHYQKRPGGEVTGKSAKWMIIALECVVIKHNLVPLREENSLNKRKRSN